MRLRPTDRPSLCLFPSFLFSLPIVELRSLRSPPPQHSIVKEKEKERERERERERRGGGEPLCRSRNGFLFSDVNISSTRAHSPRNKRLHRVQPLAVACEKERGACMRFMRGFTNRGRARAQAVGIQVLARIAQRVRHFGYVIDVILSSF